MRILAPTYLYVGHGVTLPQEESIVATHFGAIERVIGYMQNNSADPLDLRQLATVAGISKYHFIRVFTSITGITPMTFLTCLRLEHAKRLFLATGATVTEVCQKVGYSSIGSFSDTFTRLVGMTPSRYRASPAGEDYFTFPESPGKERGDRAKAGWIHGRILASGDWLGRCCVGIFPTRVIAGRPMAGTTARADGTFSLPRPACRNYCLVALQIPESGLRFQTLDSPLIAQHEVRGDTELESEPIHLTLREPLPTDPPLVLSLRAPIKEISRFVA